MKRFLLKLTLTAFLLMGMCAVVGIAEGNAQDWLFAGIALIGANAVCGILLKE